MKEFLSSKGIPFDEKDVASDMSAREEMFEKSGGLAVPTVLIGPEVVVGFDRNKIEKLLH